MNYNKIIKKEYGQVMIDYGIIYGAATKAILIKTGQNGNIYGYNNKYLEMANCLNKNYDITVVVSSNPYDCTDSLGQALELIREENRSVMDVYFMGVSNGAVLGARFGHLHSEIKRMLLINGPLMINWPQSKKGLEKFQGELATLIYGSLDPSYRYVGLIDLINNSTRINKVIVDGADHNFRNMDEYFQRLPDEYLL